MKRAAKSLASDSVLPSYVALLKPSLTLMSTLTGVGGYSLGVTGGWNVAVVLKLLLMTVGTLAIGGGAAALNQYMERSSDALMKRTESRPLPSGKIPAVGALLLGVILTAGGLLYFFRVNSIAGCVAAVISVSYLFLYTPLKKRSAFSTLAGGVPGALPPVLGWATARGSVTPDAVILFAILFFWQIPHFLALAWLYRNDYQRAGIRLLSLIDQTGTITSRHALVSLALLLPASLMPALTGLVFPVYVVVAFLVSGYYFVRGVQFAKSSRDASLGEDAGA
ncbi:MAG: heme o synthase, partial [Ignavibacteriales bacterium]|nr:heme o synthase [Ignavibacteriales bacterium]